MEKFDSGFEKADPWRRAILAERKRKTLETTLSDVLNSYRGLRKNALILGDASLVQSKLLLEEKGFEHIVDVDSSPTLLDDEIIPIEDERVDRVLSEFDKYTPSSNTFDLVFGKSIAFNPKETIEEVLKKIANSLTATGIFYAIYAAEGDSFRQGNFYSQEELENLYQKANLEIIESKEYDEEVSGLINPGRAHEIKILSKRKE